MIEYGGDIYTEFQRHGAPCGAGIEITSACNLDCVHCYHARSEGPDLPRAEVEQLLRDLAALGVLELTFTGGEPFSRPDFLPILRFAVVELGFSVKIFSNLTRISASTADYLAEFPLNRIETSLLGHTAALHDALTRRTGSFDACLAGIRLLRERNIRVSAKTVVMRPNRASIPEMYRLARSLGIPFRHDDGIFVESGGGRKPLSLRISESEARRERKKRGWREAGSVPRACNAAKSVIHISADGAVFPCGPFPIPAGNINLQSLESIWRNAQIMRRVRSLSDAEYRVCRNCRYRFWCNGCLAMGMGLAAGRKYPCRLARMRLRGVL